MESQILWNARKIIYKFSSTAEMELFLKKLKIIEVNKPKENYIEIEEERK